MTTLPVAGVTAGDEETVFVVTSSNGDIFCVTGPLRGEFTGNRWIPLPKASDAEPWCFLRSAPKQTVEQTTETLVIWDAIALIMASLQWWLELLLTTRRLYSWKLLWWQIRSTVKEMNDIESGKSRWQHQTHWPLYVLYPFWNKVKCGTVITRTTFSKILTKDTP